MSYQKKKSVLPIYLIGVVWLLWALFGSLTRPTQYILAALTSLAVYYLGKILFPDRAYQMPDPQPAPAQSQPAEPSPQTQTGQTQGDKTQDSQTQPAPSGEVAALLQERDRALSELRRLNDAIDDPKISSQILRLEHAAGQILSQVSQEPDKLPQIRTFLQYYLPTTLKLLNAYDRMDEAGISGVNIDGTKGKIKEILERICLAFERQLDALYGAEALDISTDITVMEQMLAQEGLAGPQFPPKT